jgi:YesN/AraC family two-component response regulator
MYKYKRIIIVEDEPIVALDFEYLFINNGYKNISSFYSGKEAIEDISLQKPDLALLDIRLEDEISGLDVAIELQKFNIPFIFISAFSDQNNYTRALSLDPAHLFYKPVNSKALMSTVESILNKVKVN